MSKLIALSKKEHANYSFKKLTNFITLKNQNICRVCMAEIKKLSVDWPLCFIKLPDKKLSLFAMQGFFPGQNLFVDDKGNWLHQYIPAWNRFLPFWFVVEKNLIAFHEELDCVTENPNDKDEFYPLFDKEKNISKELLDHLYFIRKVIENTHETDSLITQLDELKLIVSWPIKIKFEKEEKTIEGIYTVDRKKLENLSSTNINKIFKTKALELAYAQLLSTENLNKMVNRYIAKTKNNFAVDDNLNLREKALAKDKNEKTKELNELVENLLND